MSLKDELEKSVADVVHRTLWKTKKGEDIPDISDIKLEANEAVLLNKATVLFADIAGSSKMVREYSWDICAEIYKTFLECSSRIIRHFGGTVTAFDGDRVMGVFYTGYQNTAAAKSALGINWAVCELIRPAIKKQYGDRVASLNIAHGCGIDVGPIRVIRCGIRGANDLVWIGGAANKAAKLSEIRDNGYASWITPDAYGYLLDDAKLHLGKSMWDYRIANGEGLYASTWWSYKDF